MTLATHSFYVENFQGAKIPSDFFTKYITKADYTLKRMTQNRAVTDQYETQYNLAACEIAEYYYDYDQNSGKVLTSETVGNYSVNYTVNNSKEYDLALQYLANSGLLALGVYCI
jgi:hypothetical protein